MSKSVKAALVANGLIACAKGLAAFFTGSASMMAEAIHSTADCGNQILVLVGQNQAKRGKSEAHAFGQGKANFFWSFVVAVVLFLLGGLFSIYEGIHKIMDPKEIENPWLIVSIIIFAVALEGSALSVALKESNSKLKDIFKEDNVYLLQIKGKGNKPRVVMIKSSIIESDLNHWLEMRVCNSDLLVCNQKAERLTQAYISRIVENILISAGIRKEKNGAHMLRHTFATLLYAKHHDLILVQEALGHADINTSRIYTHFDKDRLYKTTEIF